MKGKRIFRLAVIQILALLGSGQASSFAFSWEVVAAHGVGDGGAALDAPIGSPRAIAVDAQGRLYIADIRHARIRVVEDGRISTVAGTGSTGYDGDGITGSAARVNYPTGIAVGSGGTVYFVDQQNHRIRAVGADGIIHTIAGDGRQGFGGDGGPGTLARLSNATGIVADASGNLYVTDTANHRIRKVTSDGHILTVAGTGQRGHTGDGGPAEGAALRYPTLIAINGEGSIYFFDSGNRVVRRIDADGVVSATGIEGLVDGLAADADGNVYYSQYGSVWRFRNGQPQMILGIRATAEGVSPVPEKAVVQPSSLATDASGSLLVTDLERSVIVRVSAARGVEPVAGNGTPARYGDGGPANGASFACGQLVIGEDGTIFFTDLANDRIAVVRPDGRIETHGGSAAPAMSGPAGMVMDAQGNIYVSDFGHNRVLKLEATASVTVVAGTGEQGFSGDGGPGTAAMLDGPGGLALDGEGRLYISDARNMRIRRLDADGGISTIAGNGERGEPPDGAPAMGSPLGRPGGLTVTSDGEVLVAVDSADVVRRITAGGNVYTHRPEAFAAPLLDVAARLGKELPLRTAAGTGMLRLDTAVTEALGADFAAASGPRRLGGVAFDAQGEWLYACDTENRSILRARVGSDE